MKGHLERTIRSSPAIAEPISTEQLGEDISTWLGEQASSYHLKWLLAHADDGVIWGRIDRGQLITSYDVAREHPQAKKVCPPLRLVTLQQARLFCEHAELLLWRDGGNRWRVRLIRDANSGKPATWTDAIDEPHILWGTDVLPLANGFTFMRDGAQGLCHAVPLVVDTGSQVDDRSDNRPLCLWVRHYLQEDADGFSRIAASRLLRLETEETE